MLGILLFFVVFVLVIRRLFFVSSREDPPCLSNKLPFIGHGVLLAGGSIKFYNTFKQISVECAEKGGIIKMYIGPRMVYIVTDPDDCFKIANTCLEKATLYDLLKPALGEGLFTANVVTWKRHRKLLNPAFKQLALNSFIGIFNSKSRRLVDTFAAKVNETFDHDPFLRSNNLETICMTTMGTSFDNRDLFNDSLVALNEFIRILIYRYTHFWLLSNFIFNLSTIKRKTDIVVNKLHEFSNAILQKRKTEICKRNQIHNYTESAVVQPLLDKMIELADKTNCFTDKEILDETNTILAAGHDTTASTLTFALILLGSYPEVQNKVYEEIVKVIGNTDRNVDKDDLSELVYIEAVLKETMRLYPIGPLIGRHIDRKIKLKNYTLEPNKDCLLSIISLHHHEMWGPDASKFRPERWLEPETLPDLNYYFGAFGLGRRSCIGRMYTMMSMKISLVHLIRKFKITSDISQLVLKLDVMLRPDTGHQIKLELR